jgi:hypothetical protein
VRLNEIAALQANTLAASPLIRTRSSCECRGRKITLAREMRGLEPVEAGGRSIASGTA